MYSTQPVFVSVGHLCILHSLFLVCLGYLCSVFGVCTWPVFGVCSMSVGHSTQPVFGVCRTPMYSTQACFWCL